MLFWYSKIHWIRTVTCMLSKHVYVKFNYVIRDLGPTIVSVLDLTNLSPDGFDFN